MSVVQLTSNALDRLPRPPSAELLGWRLLEARPADGWVRIGFEGRPEFLNPAGCIQGGFLSAMLDDTMGPAVFLHTDGALYTATIGFNVTFMAPARPGPLIGEGQVIQLGKTVGFVDAWLTDPSGVLVARASASVRLVPAERALA